MLHGSRYSPDGRWLAHHDVRDRLQVVSAATGEVVATRRALATFRWLPDSTGLLLTDFRQALRWDPATDDTRWVVEQGGWIGSDPHGRRVVAGGAIRDAHTGQLLIGLGLPELSPEGHHLAFSPDGSYLLLHHRRERVDGLEIGGPHRLSLEGLRGRSAAGMVSPSGRWAIDGGWLLDRDRGWARHVDQEAPLLGHFERVLFDEAHGRVLLMGTDSRITVGDLRSAKVLGFDDRFNRVALMGGSPSWAVREDAQLVGFDGLSELILRALPSGEPIERFTLRVSRDQIGYAPPAHFLDRGNTLLAGRAWWRTDTGEQLGALDTKGRVWAGGVSPDERQWVVALPGAYLNGEVHVTLELWEPPARRCALEGGPTRVTAVAYAPDGARLATGHAGPGSPRVGLWDPATCRRVAELDVGIAPEQLAFSPDGSRLLVGSSQGQVDVWDPRSGEHLATLFHGGPSWVLMDREGRFLLGSPHRSEHVAVVDRRGRAWTAHQLPAAFETPGLLTSVLQGTRPGDVPALHRLPTPPTLDLDPENVSGPGGSGWSTRGAAWARCTSPRCRGSPPSCRVTTPRPAAPSPSSGGRPTTASGRPTSRGGYVRGRYRSEGHDEHRRMGPGRLVHPDDGPRGPRARGSGAHRRREDGGLGDRRCPGGGRHRHPDRGVGRHDRGARAPLGGASAGRAS